MRPGGGHAAGDLESVGIEFENRHAAQHLLVGLKEIVVVDSRSLAENPPSIRPVVGLRGTPLDAVEQGVLMAVGGGHIKMLKKEQASAEQRRHYKNRQRKPEQAHAGSFDCRDFIVLAEDSEAHQDRHQYSERGRQIDQLRREMQEVIEHHGDGNIVADHVIQQVDKQNNHFNDQ